MPQSIRLFEQIEEEINRAVPLEPPVGSYVMTFEELALARPDRRLLIESVLRFIDGTALLSKTEPFALIKGRKVTIEKVSADGSCVASLITTHPDGRSGSEIAEELQGVVNRAISAKIKLLPKVMEPKLLAIVDTFAWAADDRFWSSVTCVDGDYFVAILRATAEGHCQVLRANAPSPFVQ
ncbi:MAG TPA: hypothetical protein VNO50_23480 [Pyrinomonadaceae bacterium]|nr:hypothetical protein [Pyrinomonadaceae bacterium]